ncbi:MAG: acyl-CoA dehydrogenase family protein [Deltaproteobacteria bacterium]|nr:acyl-CoA dehydrogenase family protein [Deltaproteobacteria bacterium]
MDFFFDQEHLLLRSHIRSWVEKNLLSASKKEADIEKEAHRLVSQLGQEGFIAYAVSKRFGGVRDHVQARDLCLLREELARGSSLADTMLAMQALGSYPITIAGSDQQKARYLPPIARGEAIAAFALTEPQAGSDISSMETRAVRRGKEYRLTGSKCFISNAGIAQTYVVFALTGPEKSAKGISAFVVGADTPGFVIKEKIPLISPHPIGSIAFEECRVPETQRLGREGEGLKIALRTLDTLRCTVGAAAIGLAQRALEEAIQYGQSRRQFGQALAEFQITQFKLADMATDLEASRLLVYQAAWMNDHGQKGLTQKSSMAKLFATEAAQRIVDQALQIHGGMGLVVGTPVEQLYRDVRALRIYEGTSEIQRLVIARTLLKGK